MSMRPCPTCGTITQDGLCPQHPPSSRTYRPQRNRAVYNSAGYRRLRLAVLDSSGWTCAYCRTIADTTDHVIPHSHGGTTTADNLVAACRPCNFGKGDRTLNEWIDSGGAPTQARDLQKQRQADGLPT